SRSGARNPRHARYRALRVAAGCSSPPLTAAARAALSDVGRDEETDSRRTKKRPQATPFASFPQIVSQSSDDGAANPITNSCAPGGSPLNEQKWVRSRERRGPLTRVMVTVVPKPTATPSKATLKNRR